MCAIAWLPVQIGDIYHHCQVLTEIKLYSCRPISIVTYLALRFKLTVPNATLLQARDLFLSTTKPTFSSVQVSCVRLPSFSATVYASVLVSCIRASVLPQVSKSPHCTTMAGQPDNEVW